jgi:hypothetical protein
MPKIILVSDPQQMSMQKMISLLGSTYPNMGWNWAI